MSAKVKRVGILAGEGALPVQLIEHCCKKNIPVCAVQFQGCQYAHWPDIPILDTRLEKVGEIFKFFRKNNVDHVVMIGTLKRPSFSSMRPDLRGMKTLGKIAKAMTSGGDDVLLRTLRSEIEEEGYTVVGVDYYLKDLTAEIGCLTRNTCPCDDNSFLNKAIDAAITHGQEDKGQSILAHTDGSYSYEGPEGTTALIREEGRKGSILVKMLKPQQDPDLDRPTVGIHTLKMLNEKQCAGMAIQAEAVFMVNKDEMIAYANENGLFIEAINA